MHASHDLGMAFDLGISRYVSKDRPNPAWTTASPPSVPKRLPGNQFNINEAVAVVLLPGAQRSWNVSQAVSQATQTQLPESISYMQGNADFGRNLQQSAIKDFLSVYSVVRDDAVGGVAVQGTRGGVAVVNGSNPTEKADIRNYLFGTGTSTGAMISSLYVGGNGTTQNSLANIRNALTNLGLSVTSHAAHQNHFPIYLRPPAAERVHALVASPNDDAGLANSEAPLLAASVPTALQPINQETVMMDFFVPPQMSVNPIVMVAHAGAGTPKTMKPFTICKDIDGGMALSAWNQFSVFGNGELMKLNQIPNYKVTLLQAPTHGMVVFEDKNRTPVSEIATALSLTI